MRRLSYVSFASSALLLGVSVAVGGIACSSKETTPSVLPRPVESGGSSSNATGGQGGSYVVPSIGGSGPGLITEMPKDAGPDAPEEAGTCDDLTIKTYEPVPTVMLVVDTSGSMFKPQSTPAWDPLFKALMDPTNGVVAMLQNKVRFGFTSYTSPRDVSPTCPVLLSTDGDPKLNALDAIKTVYTKAGTNPDIDGNTPTGPTLVAVTKKLLAFTPDPPGPKFILLVTDGDPDLCNIVNPNCGQDQSIKAVQDAYAQGIGTFVIGIGDITNEDQCDKTMRTCKMHLQDLANAGVGQPVAPNTENYMYSNCINHGPVAATYAATVAEGGTAPFYTVSTNADATAAQKKIADAIIASLAQTRSCSFNMDAAVKGDASLGTLKYNDALVPFDASDTAADGWSLGADLTSVTIKGATCNAWKKSGGTVNVNFPCKLVKVDPIPPPVPK